MRDEVSEGICDCVKADQRRAVPSSMLARAAE